MWLLSMINVSNWTVEEIFIMGLFYTLDILILKKLLLIWRYDSFTNIDLKTLASRSWFSIYTSNYVNQNYIKWVRYITWVAHPCELLCKVSKQENPTKIINILLSPFWFLKSLSFPMFIFPLIYLLQKIHTKMFLSIANYILVIT